VAAAALYLAILRHNNTALGVVVIGVGLFTLVPEGRVLDVLEIQLRPVLLGQRRLLFEDLPPEHIELDLVRTLEAPGVLHLRYEVRRG
jgi:hypothetical protein